MNVCCGYVGLRGIDYESGVYELIIKNKLSEFIFYYMKNSLELSLQLSMIVHVSDEVIYREARET